MKTRCYDNLPKKRRLLPMATAALTCLLFAANEPWSAQANERPGQRWAVLIDVDDYAALEDLEFAGADQQALAEQFIKAGFPKDQVFLLYDKASEK